MLAVTSAYKGNSSSLMVRVGVGKALTVSVAIGAQGPELSGAIVGPGVMSVLGRVAFVVVSGEGNVRVA
jgi:hypothetical protein